MLVNCTSPPLFLPQPLQLLYSGNMEGTSITCNSFRGLNQQCISVEETSNATISHNIGYKTNGHCIYIGFDSESNMIRDNLVSETLDISDDNALSGETDNAACAFVSRYNPNHYRDNVVVAAAR